MKLLPSASAALLLGSSLLLPTTAQAGASACKQCCSDAGLYSCPTKLRVTGLESGVRPDSGGYRVTGLWWLDCDEGASFDPNATAVMVDEPRPGDVLIVGYPAVTVECFLQWCRMPASGCLQERPGGGWALLRCADGQPLTAEELQQPGPEPAAVYSRTRLPSEGAPLTQPQPQPQPRPQATAPVPQPQPRPQPQPAAASPQPVAASVPAPPADATEITQVVIEHPPHLPAEGPISVQITFDLPDAPTQECSTSPALVTESLRRLDSGDEARLASRFQDAADQYRAALTLDRCSAIAWSAIGELALRADQTGVAVEALVVATRLRPDHYGALTALGQAYEARGQGSQSRDAYERVLRIRPGHRPAVEGLARLRGAGF